MQERKIKIQIIIGSTRQGRYSDKPAHWLADELKQFDAVETEILDLKDYPLPFFEEPVSPMRLNGIYSNPAVQKWADKIRSADAYIMIAPEYNHGYTAVLKNAIDHLYPEWNYKPVSFLSFGSAGGARVVEQMRQVVIELKMLPVKDALHIPAETYMATVSLERGAGYDLFNQALRKGYRDFVEAVVSDLVALANSTSSLRNK